MAPSLANCPSYVSEHNLPNPTEVFHPRVLLKLWEQGHQEEMLLIGFNLSSLLFSYAKKKRPRAPIFEPFANYIAQKVGWTVMNLCDVQFLFVWESSVHSLALAIYYYGLFSCPTETANSGFASRSGQYCEILEENSPFTDGFPSMKVLLDNQIKLQPLTKVSWD